VSVSTRGVLIYFDKKEILSYRPILTNCDKMKFDVQKIREDFPALSQTLRGNKQLVYFDNAATSQKPLAVIKAVENFYKHDNANIHRSAHELSERATTQYEAARAKILGFLRAPQNYCAVFTRGATESLNIVAQSWGQANLKEGDEILLTEMEHHANIVPWQIAAQKTGAKIVTAKILPDGSLDMEDFERKISHKTKIVSVAHASNVLGTVNDIAEISKLSKKFGAKLSIDAAQSSPHLLDDLSKCDCDFISLSAHKCFGPTGCGALVSRQSILDAMPPYQTGGDMIENVSWSGTTFRPAPERFEAGTPNIAGAIGFGAAIDYLSNIDAAAMHKHERELLDRLTLRLSDIKGLRIFGTAKEKVAVVSFDCKGIHPNDISVMLNAAGVAIRTGHHCAEPLMHTLGVEGTARASLAFYNTLEEVDYFADALKHAVDILS
jgi:cysteine desulfurase, sufS subfamily